MRANVILTHEDVLLIFEGLRHLYYENDRASQSRHVQHVEGLKEFHLKEKEHAKKLLKKIKNCAGEVNYLTSIR
jgi:hypothetical protein